jgi:hypothetical protein
MKNFEIESKNREPEEFEQQLKSSLRHIDAPEGFATRVLVRAAVSEKPLPRPRFLRLTFQASVGAIAAILVLGALVTNLVHVRRKRAQTAHIQAQFNTAMRITDRSLSETRAKLERIGLKLAD